MQSTLFPLISDGLPEPLQCIAATVAAAGGRAIVVGGWVRDRLLGLDAKDIDVEVFGLPRERVEDTLSRFGEVVQVGRSFNSLRVKGLDVDFSLAGPGGRVSDIAAAFGEAATRRDLTINAMGFDPLSNTLLDPHGGRADLAAARLRATDPARFADDPLRGLRVAQFASRFEMQADPALMRLCAALDLSRVAPERIFEELRKLLLKGRRPSVGFELLSDTGLIQVFPEIAALRGVPQDPIWHPEGDVWVHTLLSLDAAAALRDGGADDLALMLAVLCHDLGKPETTEVTGARVTARGHSGAGVEITQRLLERLRAPKALTQQVCALVDDHLAPTLFVEQRAGPKAYRRLARRLEAAGVSLTLLARVARADQLGRQPAEQGPAGQPAVDAFLRRAGALQIHRRGPPDVVLGRHLIARGLTPGPHFAEILARCRAVQDVTGSTDAAHILERVLGKEG